MQSHTTPGRMPQEFTSSLTPSSSSPSLGFSHESTSLCRTGPQFCQLVCSVASAWYCAPEQEKCAVTIWCSIESEKLYIASLALCPSASPECLGSQCVMQSEN